MNSKRDNGVTDKWGKLREIVMAKATAYRVELKEANKSFRNALPQLEDFEMSIARQERSHAQPYCIGYLLITRTGG